MVYGPAAGCVLVIEARSLAVTKATGAGTPGALVPREQTARHDILPEHADMFGDAGWGFLARLGLPE